MVSKITKLKAVTKIHSSFAIALLIIVSSVNLTACSFSKKQAAPVIDLRNQKAEQQGYHIAQRGETLYFIAWRFGRDFRELASINHLKAPYAIKPGEKIYLQGKSQFYEYKRRTVSTKQPTATTRRKVTRATASVTVRRWYMPAKGQIIANYSASNKGINIAGAQGEPIKATAAGEVVYAGAGLRAYGNMLIIKHNDIYLSAYAHNQHLLVKEGQHVKAGQEIATMGSSGTNRVMLHFELRKRGKPVNPLNYIKN